MKLSKEAYAPIVLAAAVLAGLITAAMAYYTHWRPSESLRRFSVAVVTFNLVSGAGLLVSNGWLGWLMQRNWAEHLAKIDAFGARIKANVAAYEAVAPTQPQPPEETKH
jgi:hypothetical protein